MDRTQISDDAFKIVSLAGDARATAMEAISFAKIGDFDKAKHLLVEARTSIANAHNHQTDLISAEANGEDLPFSVLLIHSQDHLMCAIAVIDLAEEMVDLYKKLK